jgi:hypothetical protein
MAHSMRRHRGPTRSLEELLQDLSDRLRALENRRTVNLGGWVLKETLDGRVVLSNPARNLTVELASIEDEPVEP